MGRHHRLGKHDALVVTAGAVCALLAVLAGAHAAPIPTGMQTSMFGAQPHTVHCSPPHAGTGGSLVPRSPQFSVPSTGHAVTRLGAPHVSVMDSYGVYNVR